MSGLLYYPLDVLKFWFFDAPRDILLFYYSLNKSVLKMLSFRIMLRTFFQPIKNEYREGLVVFSICMGIAVKFFLLMADVMLLFLLLVVEVLSLALFVGLPVLAVIVLFI